MALFAIINCAVSNTKLSFQIRIYTEQLKYDSKTEQWSTDIHGEGVVITNLFRGETHMVTERGISTEVNAVHSSIRFDSWVACCFDCLSVMHTTHGKIKVLKAIVPKSYS